jgi:cell wall-associated NlpC family hydrolase
MVLAGLVSFLLWFPQGLEHPVVIRALSLIGAPYRFGGTTVERGFDCAGFVKHAYGEIGITLPRTTSLQYSAGRPVERGELEPGDLVFFRDTYRRGLSHVGIYIGNNRFVHAASTGRKVRVDDLGQLYYAKRFAGGRRVKEPPAAVVASAQ